MTPDETFVITVIAENVGDGPGTFRCAVNFSSPLYRPKAFDIVLDPGASDETTVSASSEPPRGQAPRHSPCFLCRDADPGSSLEYGVRTPAGQSTVAIAVEPESNATERTN